MPSGNEVTRLLVALQGGDREAFGLLFPLVYDELRRIAHRQLLGSRPSTLQTTAVVHEAYLKLAGGQASAPRDRSHFFAVAAQAMRQILVDHARAHLTQKRGSGAQHVLLDERDLPVEERAAELVDLDAALVRLAVLDERAAKVVELRFFGGLPVEETAEVLDISPRTVKRDWREARAFLFRELRS
ncbi:MAG: extracytoplasmic sigma factor ECF [Gemmatimonadota bacterium]|nr:MAG: extracytoplasmic sigma factor ECF [Gemmatimonadota bacterium]